MIGDGHTPAQPHSDPPRSSSTHDEPATPTARPTLLVLRHALASSRRAIEAARYPRSATIHIGSVGLHDSQRERLCSHGLQRESPQMMVLHCKSSIVADDDHTSVQNHSDMPRPSSTKPWRSSDFPLKAIVAQQESPPYSGYKPVCCSFSLPLLYFSLTRYREGRKRLGSLHQTPARTTQGNVGDFPIHRSYGWARGQTFLQEWPS